MGRRLETEECHAECETALQNEQKAAKPTGASHQATVVCGASVSSQSGRVFVSLNQLSCHCDNSFSLFFKIIFDVDHF